MSDYHFANFDITVYTPRDSEHASLSTPKRGQITEYPVTAHYKGRTANGYLTQDIHDPYWQAVMNQLSEPTYKPGSARLKEIGGRLLTDLMREDIYGLWLAARHDLETNVALGIRLRLALQPPAVACLPWETLYDRNRSTVFSASGQILLVRIESLSRHIGSSRELRTYMPIKILAVAPTVLTDSINTISELKKIENVAKKLGSHYIQLATYAGKFDVVELAQRIQEEKPDIVHLIGHGTAEGILLWRNNQPHLFTADSINTAFEQAMSVKLIILNICSAGKTSKYTQFETVAPRLLQTGVPAVVAMQADILDNMAIEFADYLYKELFTGFAPGAIDVAMGTVRRNLYGLDPDSFDFGTPILWLNAQDGIVFEMPDSSIIVEQSAKIDNEDFHKVAAEYTSATQQYDLWEDEDEFENDNRDEIPTQYSDRFIARFPNGHLDKSFILSDVQGKIGIRKSAYNDIAIDEASSHENQPIAVLEMWLSINGRSHAIRIYLVSDESIKKKVQAYDRRIKAHVAKIGFKGSIADGSVILNYEIKHISYTQSSSATNNLAGFDQVIIESTISLRNQ